MAAALVAADMAALVAVMAVMAALVVVMAVMAALVVVSVMAVMAVMVGLVVVSVLASVGRGGGVSGSVVRGGGVMGDFGEACSPTTTLLYLYAFFLRVHMAPAAVFSSSIHNQCITSTIVILSCMNSE